MSHSPKKLKIHPLHFPPFKYVHMHIDHTTNNHSTQLIFFSLSYLARLPALSFISSVSSSTTNMKASLKGQVIGIPFNSSSAAASYAFERSPKGLLLPAAVADPMNQYHNNNIIAAPQTASSKFRPTSSGRVSSVLNRMNKLGKKADRFAHGVKEHVRLGPKITETVKGKLSLGAKILRVGGLEKVFNHAFSVRAGEKLLKASQCYLSTTAGPLAGLLFISTDTIAFCSERSIKLTSPNGQLTRVHYKVVIPVNKIKIVNQSENVKKPSQKYIEIVTVDDFDFWFMGFLNFQKTLKYLRQAINSQ